MARQFRRDASGRFAGGGGGNSGAGVAVRRRARLRKAIARSRAAEREFKGSDAASALRVAKARVAKAERTGDQAKIASRREKLKLALKNAAKSKEFRTLNKSQRVKRLHERALARSNGQRLVAGGERGMKARQRLRDSVRNLREAKEMGADASKLARATRAVNVHRREVARVEKRGALPVKRVAKMRATLSDRIAAASSRAAAVKATREARVETLKSHLNSMMSGKAVDARSVDVVRASIKRSDKHVVKLERYRDRLAARLARQSNTSP